MAINFYLKAGMVLMCAARESWAKCDLVQSVSHERLDRIAVSATQQVVGYVCYQDLIAISYAIAAYFGLDPAPFRE